MKAFVIMSNDYPDSVFSTEAAAESYVAEKIEADRRRREKERLPGPIHWRCYEFEMR